MKIIEEHTDMACPNFLCFKHKKGPVLNESKKRAIYISNLTNVTALQLLNYNVTKADMACPLYKKY